MPRSPLRLQHHQHGEGRARAPLGGRPFPTFLIDHWIREGPFFYRTGRRVTRCVSHHRTPHIQRNLSQDFSSGRRHSQKGGRMFNPAAWSQPAVFYPAKGCRAPSPVSTLRLQWLDRGGVEVSQKCFFSPGVRDFPPVASACSGDRHPSPFLICRIFLPSYLPKPRPGGPGGVHVRAGPAPRDVLRAQLPVPGPRSAPSSNHSDSSRRLPTDPPFPIAASHLRMC